MTHLRKWKWLVYCHRGAVYLISRNPLENAKARKVRNVKKMTKQPGRRAGQLSGFVQRIAGCVLAGEQEFQYCLVHKSFSLARRLQKKSTPFQLYFGHPAFAAAATRSQLKLTPRSARSLVLFCFQVAEEGTLKEEQEDVGHKQRLRT